MKSFDFQAVCVGNHWLPINDFRYYSIVSQATNTKKNRKTFSIRNLISALWIHAVYVYFFRYKLVFSTMIFVFFSKFCCFSSISNFIWYDKWLHIRFQNILGLNFILWFHVEIKYLQSIQTDPGQSNIGLSYCMLVHYNWNKKDINRMR